MKIGIDIDDTITNTRDLQLKYWKEYVTKNPNGNYTEQLPTTINDFGDDYVQLFWDIYREQLSFQATVKEQVDFVTRKLRNDGHTLCIVTSRPDYKYENLRERLDDLFNKNNIGIDIIYTDVRNKGQFCRDNSIDLLIDDDIKHINSALENNIKAILFNDREDFDGLHCNNWLELYEIITSMDNNN